MNRITYVGLTEYTNKKRLNHLIKLFPSLEIAIQLPKIHLAKDLPEDNLLLVANSSKFPKTGFNRVQLDFMWEDNDTAKLSYKLRKYKETIIPLIDNSANKIFLLKEFAVKTSGLLMCETDCKPYGDVEYSCISNRIKGNLRQLKKVLDRGNRI
jgi:hypothetical protein